MAPTLLALAWLALVWCVAVIGLLRFATWLARRKDPRRRLLRELCRAHRAYESSFDELLSELDAELPEEAGWTEQFCAVRDRAVARAKADLLHKVRTALDELRPPVAVPTSRGARRSGLQVVPLPGPKGAA